MTLPHSSSNFLLVLLIWDVLILDYSSYCGYSITWGHFGSSLRISLLRIWVKLSHFALNFFNRVWNSTLHHPRLLLLHLPLLSTKGIWQPASRGVLLLSLTAGVRSSGWGSKQLRVEIKCACRSCASALVMFFTGHKGDIRTSKAWALDALAGLPGRRPLITPEHRAEKRNLDRGPKGGLSASTVHSEMIWEGHGPDRAWLIRRDVLLIVRGVFREGSGWRTSLPSEVGWLVVEISEGFAWAEVGVANRRLIGRMIIAEAVLVIHNSAI
jgi:hypothetical protein